MEAIKEEKKKTPEQRIWLGIIQQAFEDAFELGMGHNLSMAEVQKARNWFYTADCSLWCDMAGTTHDHIKKLYENLQFNYKNGIITQSELRFGIRRLEKKI